MGFAMNISRVAQKAVPPPKIADQELVIAEGTRQWTSQLGRMSHFDALGDHSDVLDQLQFGEWE